MQTEVCNPAEFDRLVHAVHEIVQRHFNLKFELLKQGLSAGYGSKSHAALLSRFRGGERVKLDRFDHFALTERLQGMGLSLETAESVSSIVDGRQLQIGLRRQPDNPRYVDTAYRLEVNAVKAATTRVECPFFFILPAFTRDGIEPYRIASDYNFKHSSQYSVSRSPDGVGLLTVEGEGGRWSGGLFVYHGDGSGDANCKRVVMAALARRILPSISPRFSCQLYRPDGYDTGAWKLRVDLGDELRRFLGGMPLVLEIPRQERRNFLPDSGYRRDIDLMHFKDGLLEAHVYTNGCPEIENPTPISEVRAVVVRSLHQALSNLNFNLPPFWAQ